MADARFILHEPASLTTAWGSLDPADKVLAVCTPADQYGVPFSCSTPAVLPSPRRRTVCLVRGLTQCNMPAAAAASPQRPCQGLHLAMMLHHMRGCRAVCVHKVHAAFRCTCRHLHKPSLLISCATARELESPLETAIYVAS